MLNITYSGIKPDRPTACALGLFDGVHRGHQDVIKCAVGYRSAGLSPAVFTFKTNTVYSKHDQALEYLLADDLKMERFNLLGVDYVFSPDFNELKSLTAEQFVSEILHKRLNAKIVVCGEDFTFGRGAFAGAVQLSELCRRLGIITIVIPFTFYESRPISSSIIREKIRSGDIETANQMLGYSFCLKLPVIHGNAIGRTLSYPTINQQLRSSMVTPKFGVYASRTFVENKYFPSITNIGVKPTVGGEKIPLCETHILGFDGDLYDEIVKIELKGFIRPEQRFSSLDELKAQIDADTSSARKMLGLKA